MHGKKQASMQKQMNKDTEKKQLELSTENTGNITALALAGNFSLEQYFGANLRDMPDDVWDEFEDVNDMESVQPRLPQIVIAHQAQMFKMPDESKVEKITGIIIDNNPVNAWWEKSFDETGGGTPPDCSALDGIRPDQGCPKPQAETCLVCPRNQFGSDGGRGKACKNMRRLHILLQGNAIPYRLTLSPANLRPFGDFMTNDVRGKRLKLIGVITEMSLVSERNQDGIEYSEIVFRIVTDDKGKPVVLASTREQAVALKHFREEWLSSMRGQEVLSDEHVTNNADFGENATNAHGDAFDVSKYSASSDEDQSELPI